MPLVTLADAKSHLRVTTDDEDEYIGGLVAAAEDHVSRLTGVSLAAVSRVFYALSIPDSGRIALPFGPVVAITGVTHLRPVGSATVDPAGYRLSGQHLLLGERPTDFLAPLTISYQTAAEAPPALRQAVMLTVGQWYDARSNVSDVTAELPFSTRHLLAPFIQSV